MPDIYSTMGQEIPWHSKALNSFGGDNSTSNWHDEFYG